MNNNRVLMADALQSRRESDVDDKVAYHKLKWDTVDPKKFTIEVTHRIAFCPGQEAKDVSMQTTWQQQRRQLFGPTQ